MIENLTTASCTERIWRDGYGKFEDGGGQLELDGCCVDVGA